MLSQVDLLLQRCFHCAENKLFCLVNADLLKYDVSSHTKDSYKKLSRLTTRKLGIVYSFRQKLDYILFCLENIYIPYLLPHIFIEIKSVNMCNRPSLK